MGTANVVPNASVAGMSMPSMPATVGAYLAARLCLSYLFFQSNPQQGAIAAFVLNIALLAIVVFYAFGPSASTPPRLLRVRCFRWVLAFLGFSLCSLYWSEAVSKAVAFGYWLGMAADVALVLVLLRTAPVATVCERFIKGYICGACFIACVMWLSPTMTDLRPGNDDFFSPNAIGFTCAVGVFLSQLYSRSQRIWRLPAAFLAVSLLRSLSKTTIVAFIAGQLVMLARDKTIRRRSKVLLVSFAGLVIAAFWKLIAAYYEVYINAGNQAETLTGRIGIWAFVLERAMERPWVGHGFHAFRNVIPPFGSFEAWHAHNELIQQFYAYGVVGVVLLIGIYGSFYLQVRRVANPFHKSLFLGLILFIVVRGLGDTERFDLSFPLWTITLLCMMMLSTRPRNEVLR